MATETAVDVVMPQMGVSVSEGTITRWLKQEGEQIEADEPLLEISTDKVDTEVPSPASGTLTQILVQEGETVDVGTKLGQIGGSAAGEAPAAESAPEPEAPAARDRRSGSRGRRRVACRDSRADRARAVRGSAAPRRHRRGNGKAFVSPVVARIASEHGVDPSQVPGTGSGGRVTKKDILAFVESGGAQQQPQQQPPAAAPEPAQAEAPAAAQPEAPAAPAPPAKAPAPPAKPPAPAPVAAGETLPGETVEPITAMRRGIAEHMRRSLDTAAHVTSAIEVDFSRIVAVRDRLKKEYQAAYGVNPTYLAFVAKASVETLRDYPYVNAEMRGDSIVTRNFVNLGIAVELAEGKGLIVPVIRNAEGLNLLGLARGIAEIANKARNKQLVPDDVQGGTFTITNPGGYGTFHGTPVISQPQSAILGTYALVKRPWVVEDELGKDVIAIRPLMNITLTYDHRLVDGALAGRFLRDLRERLEGWEGDDELVAQRLVPFLGYEDAAAAIDWLCSAFGATENTRGAADRRGRERSMHAELELEGATIFLSTPARLRRRRASHRESCEIERADAREPLGDRRALRRGAVMSRRTSHARWSSARRSCASPRNRASATASTPRRTSRATAGCSASAAARATRARRRRGDRPRTVRLHPLQAPPPRVRRRGRRARA